MSHTGSNIVVVVEWSLESLPTAFRMIDIRDVFIMDVIEYFIEVIVSLFIVNVPLVTITFSDDDTSYHP